MNDIGQNIRILREVRGLTQKQLAEASGVTLATLSRLERGGHFSTNKLAEIARALNARVSDIDPSVKEDLARLESHLAHVPQRLKQARERAGYSTAARAAEALGVAYGTYSGHENGQRGIKGLELARYAMFFNVTSDWLQFGRGTIDDPVVVETDVAGFDASIIPLGSDRAPTSPSVVRSTEHPVGAVPPSKEMVTQEDVVAAFDGVLDGAGISTERRSALREVFAAALAEPISLPAGSDRATARRAIARALGRALLSENQKV